MTSFIEIVKDILSEQNTAGSGGALGAFAVSLPGGSTDYSSNDHRLPYSLPHIHRRPLSKGESIASSGTRKKYGARSSRKRKKQK